VSRRPSPDGYVGDVHRNADSDAANLGQLILALLNALKPEYEKRVSLFKAGTWSSVDAR
jgi:hypothetical protein